MAGLFYPGYRETLRAVVDDLLQGASLPASVTAAKALIVPHAGYRYSGCVAATAYAQLALPRDQVRRVVLIGPSHRVPLRGVAVPQADAFTTPLGAIRIDVELRERVRSVPTVIASDHAHAAEHSLEVQLPFLQRLLGEFTILPLVAGLASPEEVAEVLDAVWGGSETLVLVSSDLSHYHAYEEACAIDATTAAAMLARSTQLDDEQACGSMAINGLMTIARQRDLLVKELVRLNSGDTSGDRSRVVGYGAFTLHEH